MSSKTDERTTPQELFDELNAEFHFTLDVAATVENAKCKKYFTKEDSAFSNVWAAEICFMNPPYSDIWGWLKKATNELIFFHLTIVCILPCDTSTRWFHDFLWDKEKHETRPGVQLRFPKGRYKFSRYTTSPKFATIIAVLR